MYTSRIFPVISLYKAAIFLLLSLAANKTFCQSNSWQWAKSAIGYGSYPPFSVTQDNAYAVKTDLAGNVFEAGSFYSAKLSFGSDTLMNTDTTGSTNDIYLVKYDGTGNVLWAKSAGGSSLDGALSVATDPSGNVYMCGYFTSPKLIMGTDTLINSGINDIFTAKYDASGNLLWVKGTTWVGSDYTVAMATDISGNVFITGSLSAGIFIFAGDTLRDSGNSDVFILKYDTDGNELWIKRGIGAEINKGTSVATDRSGNVYITGFYDAPVMTFDTVALHMIPDSADAYAIYLAKYDASGNLLWAKGNNNSAAIPSVFIATDTLGGVYLSGSYNNLDNSGILSFGVDTVSDNNLVFLTKYDAGGNVLWAKSYVTDTSVATANLSLTVLSETIDATGNIYMSGYFGGNAMIFGNDTLRNAGTVFGGGPLFYDAFILKCDANGNAIWATSIGGSRDDRATGVTTDISGNIFLTGYFNSSPLAFGTDTLTDNNATDTTFESGPYFPFVAKYGSPNTGIKPVAIVKPFIALYPNPVTNKVFTISVSAGTYSRVCIYNTLGMLVYETHPGSIETTMQIKLPDLSPGVYYLKASGDASCATVPFIISN